MEHNLHLPLKKAESFFFSRAQNRDDMDRYFINFNSEWTRPSWKASVYNTYETCLQLNSKPNESSKDTHVFPSGGNGETIFVIACSNDESKSYYTLSLAPTPLEFLGTFFHHPCPKRTPKNEERNFLFWSLVRSCAMLGYMKQPQQLERLF